MKKILEIQVTAGGDGTAPLGVVLSKTTHGYAVHYKNYENGGKYQGRYLDYFPETYFTNCKKPYEDQVEAFAKALKEFALRFEELAQEPSALDALSLTAGGVVVCL